MNVPKPLGVASVVDFCTRHGLGHAVGGDGLQMLIARPDPGSPPLRVIERPERGMATVAIMVELPDDAPAAADIDGRCQRINARLFAGAWIHNEQVRQLYFRLSVPTAGARYGDEAIKWLLELVVGTTEATLAEILGAERG